MTISFSNVLFSCIDLVMLQYFHAVQCIVTKTCHGVSCHVRTEDTRVLYSAVLQWQVSALFRRFIVYSVVVAAEGRAGPVYCCMLEAKCVPAVEAE